MNQIVEMLETSMKQKGCKFVSIKGYEAKGSGEVSDFVINTNVNYDKLRDADIEYLQNLKTDNELSEQARLELLESMILNKSKETATAASIGQREAYRYFSPSIKIHNETDLLYVAGIRIKKKVLIEGTFKVVKSRPLTIAKNEIKKNLKTEKYRNFILCHTSEISMLGGKFIIAGKSEFETSDNEIEI